MRRHPRAHRAIRIVINALPHLVRQLAKEDTEATAEQAGGSDELGGLLTFGFASAPTEIGDLNESNLERRLNAIKWGGGTLIMPSWQLALEDYDGEFGDREPAAQPVHLVLVITDGEAIDWASFTSVLEDASPRRIFGVAIVGHGPKALATYNAYKQAAERQQAKDKFGKSHVHVVLFDGVTDPDEIGQDLATMAG